MARVMVFFTVLLAIAASARAVDVGTCEEFAAVDRKTETEVTITAADFKCEEYTRLSIRTDMVLKSAVGKVTFSNLALKIYKSLTVEPDVVFTGVTLVGKNGGALKVELGAVGVFKGTAGFHGNSISETEIVRGGFANVVVTHKGGAIHNKGSLIFEKDASFADNHNGEVGAGDGPGGAISVHVKGSIHFMGNLVMTDNTADWFGYRGTGGALHNLGDVVVDGEAEFSGNSGGRGGAIYQEKWATIVFNKIVNFTSNSISGTFGGAVCNFGGEFTCEGGSLFFDNIANNGGCPAYGGGIYNEAGGVVTLKGSTNFSQNFAFFTGGAICNRVEPYPSEEPGYDIPLFVYPGDTVFEDNTAQYCNDVAYGVEEESACGL